VGKKRKPPICDYCQGPTEFVDDSEVYERSYGRKVYLCRPCNAWVGVHKGTTRPLGRLAKSELRKMKIQAHAHLGGRQCAPVDGGRTRREARLMCG